MVIFTHPKCWLLKCTLKMYSIFMLGSFSLMYVIVLDRKCRSVNMWRNKMDVHLNKSLTWASFLGCREECGWLETSVNVESLHKMISVLRFLKKSLIMKISLLCTYVLLNNCVYFEMKYATVFLILHKPMKYVFSDLCSYPSPFLPQTLQTLFGVVWHFKNKELPKRAMWR